MKNLTRFTVIVLSIVLFACGGDTKTETTNNEETLKSSKNNELNTEGMDKIDLSKYDLNASIFIPNASKGKPEISTTDWGSIQIKVGKRYGIEIVPFGMSAAEKKEELDGDLVYSIEYIEDTENSLIYKKTINNSEVDPELHFFVTKEIEGDLVEIKNLTEETYKKGTIEKMKKSAESLSTKSAS